MEAERPYYIRPSPAILLTQPLDGTLSFGESMNLTCKVMGMEAIISGWWPHIYWRHNDSIVNSTWPENVTVDTNYWDVTTLHSPYPGTYQCVVDDGSFILASRLATVKEGEHHLSLPTTHASFIIIVYIAAYIEFPTSLFCKQCIDRVVFRSAMPKQAGGSHDTGY